MCEGCGPVSILISLGCIKEKTLTSQTSLKPCMCLMLCSSCSTEFTKPPDPTRVAATLLLLEAACWAGWLLMLPGCVGFCVVP